MNVTEFYGQFTITKEQALAYFREYEASRWFTSARDVKIEQIVQRMIPVDVCEAHVATRNYTANVVNPHCESQSQYISGRWVQIYKYSLNKVPVHGQIGPFAHNDIISYEGQNYPKSKIETLFKESKDLTTTTQQPVNADCICDKPFLNMSISQEVDRLEKIRLVTEIGKRLHFYEWVENPSLSWTPTEIFLRRVYFPVYTLQENGQPVSMIAGFGQHRIIEMTDPALLRYGKICAGYAAGVMDYLIGRNPQD